MAVKGLKKDFDKEKMYAKIMPSFAPAEYVEEASPGPPAAVPPVRSAARYQLRNYTENLVMAAVDTTIQSLEGCGCEGCKKQVLALALDALPSCYRAMEPEEIPALLEALHRQLSVKVRAALIQAVQQVKQNPNH